MKLPAQALKLDSYSLIKGVGCGNAFGKRVLPVCAVAVEQWRRASHALAGDPPKEVQERTLTQRRGRSHGEGIGM